jgi:DNA-directed RNA polymerase subunit RPC12/RpoP
VNNGIPRPGTTGRPRYVPVFSIDLETSRAFIETLSGKSADSVETVVEDATLFLEAFAGENAHVGAIKESLKKADAAILLVRFTDSLSINQLREIYQALPTETFLPRAFMIFRQKGEVEFKMSCLHCGQKLWVRDADTDRAGRCPHCKKMFRLPSQQANVRSLLSLPPDVAVSYVSQGNPPACAHAVAELVGKIGDREAKTLALETTRFANTQRIELPPGETSSGAH